MQDPLNETRFVRFVTRTGHYLQRIEELLLAGSILMIAALTILNVVCRALLGFSLAFTEEVTQFCIICVCFVGLSYAASQGRHIRMTAIYDLLSPQVRKIFMIVITSSTAVLMFLLSGYAGAYVLTVFELGGIYPALRVPFYVVYSVASLGLFLAGIQYTLATARNLSSDDVYISFDRKDEHEQPLSQEI